MNDKSTFQRIEPNYLEGSIAVIPQGLDNQWVPQSVLKEMLKSRKDLLESRSIFEHESRANYIRSLINNEKTLIDRAFFYNNPVVSKDFLQHGQDRKAFESLLSQEAIIQILGYEKSPLEIPKGFSKDDKAVKAWGEVASETPISCLRLTWDDKEIKKSVHQKIAMQFDSKLNGLQTADSLIPTLRVLKSDPACESSLRLRLLDLAQAKIDFMRNNPGNVPQREFYYEKFVVGDGTNPVDGKYDSKKEFVEEIKLLLDLAHATARADAYQAFSASPPDSPSRMALQEVEGAKRNQASKDWDADALVKIIQRVAFDIVQQALSVPDLHVLSLMDIISLRQTDEWTDYISTLKQFISPERDLLDPNFFVDQEHGVPILLKRYRALASKIVPALANRKANNFETSPWMPVAELVVEVAGARLFVELGKKLGITIDGDLSHLAVDMSKRAVIRFVVRNSAKARYSLENTFQLREGRLQNARQQWEMLVKKVSEISCADIKGRCKDDSVLDKTERRDEY